MQPITNLRVLGGHNQFTGAAVKPGYFYRAGQLDQLDAQQQTYLRQKLRLQRIVDFRTADERQRYPDVRLAGVTYEVIDVLAATNNNGASLQSMVAASGAVHARMCDLYEHFALAPTAQAGYHQFLTSLLVPQPVLFHCFAGKDRTGIAAALILKCLGVSDAAILADYLATNQARQAANQQILAHLAAQVSADQLRAVQAALVVDQDYLTHYFEVIEQHYGSFEHYLVAGLRLAPTFTRDFQQLYLEA